MRIRNPDEPTSYIQITGRSKATKRFKSRGLTVYGATPEELMQLVQKALKESEAAKSSQIRRSAAVPA